MPDRIQPPTPLTPSARRALAAAMITAESALPGLCSAVAADIIDAVSAAVLRSAGVTDPIAARAVLHSLWSEAPR